MTALRQNRIDKTHKAIDAIMVEVIGNAISSIAEEMGETLVRSSYSTNIKERRDCSTALFDAQGRTIYQAEHIPIHLGSLIGVIEAILARYPEQEIQDGDIFIGNDAYSGGGTHLPDIVLASPIFHRGHIVAWATNLAHHADFVDRGHKHIFQEGLRIPPIRLQRASVLQQDILDLILLNCQVPRERLNDLRAQMAANRFGVNRFQGLCEKYGQDLLLEACDSLMDYAERRTRAGITNIPDGIYAFEDDFDCDELDESLLLKVVVEVRGDEIYLDFSDNPPQVQAGLNMVETALLATVYYAVKTVVDPNIPPNAGLHRPIKVSAPKGSVLNAVSPAAVNGRVSTCQRVVDLIHGALAKAVPDRIVAAGNGACVSITFDGIDPRSGQFFVYLETIGGGFGARATKDGLDGVHVHMTNTSNLPVESLEAEYPLIVEKYELVENSGGVGRHRGGMGIRRKIRSIGHTSHIFAHGSRRLSSPWGLFGGGPGGRYSVEVSDGVPALVKGNGYLSDGQSITIETPGAGGYGPPSERSAEQVACDLREERISERIAKEQYGFTKQP